MLARILVGLTCVLLALLAAKFAPESGSGLLWLWVTFGLGFMGSRAVVLLHRARGERWLVTGA